MFNFFKWFSKKETQPTSSDLIPKGIKETVIPKEFDNVLWEHNSEKVSDNIWKQGSKFLIVG